MYDIITIGAATRDVFLESKDFKFIKSGEFVGGVGECLALGSKNEVTEIFFSTGGGATNAAVTFARLGLKVAVIGRVGRDSAGDEVSAVLKKEGVETKFIQRDQWRNTAYSTLLIYGGGERTVLIYRGPANEIELPERVLNKIKTKWFYVTSLGGRIDLLRVFWNYAKKNKIKIAWNPGGEELKLGLGKLLPFIEQCEVFNVNREEATKVTGCDWKDQNCLFTNLCGILPIAIITDGSRGAYGCVAKRQIWYTPTLGTKPKNTTGAGDAFGSGFVAGLIKKNDIDFALRLGTLNADSVIREMGAKTGILKKLPGPKELSKVKIEKL